MEFADGPMPMTLSQCAKTLAPATVSNHRAPMNEAKRRAGAPLTAVRGELVRRFIEAELLGDADGVVRRFATPRYDLVASSLVLDGADLIEEAVYWDRMTLRDQLTGGG